MKILYRDEIKLIKTLMKIHQVIKFNNVIKSSNVTRTLWLDESAQVERKFDKNSSIRWNSFWWRFTTGITIYHCNKNVQNMMKYHLINMMEFTDENSSLWWRFRTVMISISSMIWGVLIDLINFGCILANLKSSWIGWWVKYQAQRPAQPSWSWRCDWAWQETWQKLNKGYYY